MNYTIEFIGCVFEAIIFWQFFKRVLQSRKIKILWNIVLLICLAAINFGVNYLNNSIVNLILGVIVYFAFSIVLFVGNLKERIFYFIVFYTVFAGTEIVCEFALIFFNGNNYNWNELPFVESSVIYCFEKLLTFIFLYVLTKVLKVEDQSIEKRFFIFSLLLPMTTFCLYSVLLYSEQFKRMGKQYAILLVIVCILLLFCNAIIFYMYDYVFLLLREKQKKELVLLKANMEKHHYENIEIINERQAKYMHDITNYLKTIGILAQEEKNEEISAMLDSMEIHINSLSMEQYTNSKILNAILCEKKDDAEKKRIEFSIHVDPYIDFSFIDEIDLITIVGNILDNAIEASCNVMDRFIDISIVMAQKNHFFMIKVDNSYDGNVLIRNNKLISLKTDDNQHGFGLDNVKDVLKKYEGFMEYEMENDIFSVVIVIPV